MALDVYFMPLSSFSGLLINASIIPNSMPNTGPPMIGTIFPSSHAGTAMIKQVSIPINILFSNFMITSINKSKDIISLNHVLTYTL